MDSQGGEDSTREACGQDTGYSMVQAWTLHMTSALAKKSRPAIYHASIKHEQPFCYQHRQLSRYVQTTKGVRIHSLLALLEVVSIQNVCICP